MGRGMDISLEEGQEVYLGTGARCFSGGGQQVKLERLERFPSPVMAQISPLLPFIIKADASPS